ncbi:diguanylate cyclase (GGDEF) domain-containing protein [Ferrimonas sediminum]|uniref:diguanylate cyclase n=1 Tax=Ferrimonas sediminum TaxID=718193 RepID=A0A1G8MGC6_9GAMM|nr:diguanylate cyclase [Ferrimonas sediminum]SDI66966.1 diguanylate cyclase (GGDEF) domain-containing protein [Ferrimonas sediminum]
MPNKISPNPELDALHLLTQLVQTIEVGLVVLDRDCRVHLWNSFMENHSGKRASQLRGKRIFDLFAELPERWLTGKLETAFLLNNRAFTTWEQRPFIFEFPNSRPVTGQSPYMYQNLTIQPLSNRLGEVNHVALLVYDVTVEANHRMALARMSQIDTLTGLANRRLWQEHLDKEFERSRRYHHPATLMVLDIDHFKSINDTLGHSAGDTVLAQVGQQLRKLLRKSDIAARYGGEEFTLLLPETDTEQAALLAERIRSTMEAQEVSTESGVARFTVSIGYALFDPGLSDDKQWFSAADKALYEAKRSGRNRCILYSESLDAH